MIDGFAMAGCFSQTNITGNRCPENQTAVKTPEVGGNGCCQVRSLVVHREQQAFDFQKGIHGAPKPRQGVEEFRHTLKRVILALDGDQQRIGGGQRVERQKVQCRRTIEQNIVVIILDWRDGFPQEDIAVVGVDEFHFGARQVPVRRHYLKPKSGGLDEFAQWLAENQSVIGGSADGAAIDTHA